MPWGQNADWPTEEMRGRGNVRSLWMGVLWALTSGTGVAVALLQGSAGPLIGVAISASLLPPVVNCGLFWSQACIWLIYPEKRIPHLKNEAMNSTSAYPFLYTDYLPTEFLINGIVSACLTVVNVICIFITAIIVLKIKEVSAPYTASPDLKRFWETDLRTVRKTNRSTMRRGAGGKYMSGSGTGGGSFAGLDEARDAKMDTALERALAQAESDVTFRKVKRMSYSNNAVGELTERLAKIAGLNKRHLDDPLRSNSSSLAGSRINSIPNAPLDLKALDKLVSSLLEQHAAGSKAGDSSLESGTRTPPVRKASKKLNRWRPLSRSAHSFKRGGGGGGGGAGDARDFTQLQERSEMQSALSPHPPNMPTIMESSAGSPTPNNAHASNNNPWTASLERTPAAVRNMLHNIAAGANNAEDQLNLTQNYVG
ncbi:CG34109 [Drosophila busckii]|uniref:CG34109 n=1 Tax=Drosophila busckii TaxID=30019 RepID=A0A0M4E538_DROBS|nr:CG34109 [Drosophila busckii]